MGRVGEGGDGQLSRQEVRQKIKTVKEKWPEKRKLTASISELLWSQTTDGMAQILIHAPY